MSQSRLISRLLVAGALAANATSFPEKHAAAAPPETSAAPPRPPANALAAPLRPAAQPAPPAPAAQPAPPVAAQPAPAGPIAAAPKKHKPFELASDDGAFSLGIGALVHADGRFFLAGTGTDTFLLRRVRPDLKGHVFKYFEFRVYSDLAGGQLQILDAWGNLHFIDEAQLWVGKGKAPVGLERLQSPADMSFAERAFPTSLVPNRDIGVKLHGKLFDDLVEYAVGVYNGVPNGGSGDLDPNNEKDIAGRLLLHPFITTGIEPLEGFGIGIAATRGTQGAGLPTYRSSRQEPYFRFVDGVSADGERVLWTPQGYYYYGPLGLMAEYVRVTERTSNGTTANEMTSEAWQLAGSVVVYGGKPSYKGVSVARPLDPDTGGIGAFEVGARYGELHISSDVYRSGQADPSESANRASAWAVGVSWHFATRVKALANYERTSFHRGRSSGDRQTEGLLVTRLQVAF